MKQNLFAFFLYISLASASTDTCPYPCNGHPLTAYYAKNPRGCAWFFTCNIGLPPQEGRCPKNFVFNHELQICDYPDNVQCSDMNPITACPDFGIKKIPHPDTCSKYILCFDGKEQDRLCPLGKHFSIFDDDCVSPDRSDCVIDQIFCDSKRNEQSNIFPKIANPRACGTFYVCSEDNWVINQNCFDGWHFNPDSGLCEDPTQAGCDTSNEQQVLEFIPENIEFDCSNAIDGSAHPHPESCDFWFLCVGRKSYLQMCGTDAKFDTQERRCVSKDLPNLSCSNA